MNTTTPFLAPPEPTLASLTLRSSSPSARPQIAAPATDEAQLREALKRCSPSTLDAALAYRRTGDATHLPALVTGVIGRFVERELRDRLLTEAPAPTLRLVEDLGLDSLTLMEIVILTEDVLPVTINNDELRHLRTLGDVQTFITAKLSAAAAAIPASKS